MKIDSSIVQSYLDGKSGDDYSEHWIFYHLTDGKKLFDEPAPHRKSEIEDCLRRVIEVCENFEFLNHGLVDEIFGDIHPALQQTNLLLVVGCPPPYDAMVRSHKGVEYIVFDLVSFVNYSLQGYDFVKIVRGMLTHEVVHTLINARYPQQEMNYTEKLSYIAFHEGFAHLLAFCDDISTLAPTEEHKKRFDTAKMRFEMALLEKDPKAQHDHLFEANTGNYWDKFAAISSKLYLLKNIMSLKCIYEQGWQDFAKKVVEYNWE